MAMQFVTLFRKSRKARSDSGAPEAIADAARRGNMHFEPFKTTRRSRGGHARLGSISCRGDAYRRTLLIQGARSCLQRAKAVATGEATPEQLWIRLLDGRMPFGKVLVAIASKHVRQLWAMLAHEVDYELMLACIIRRIGRHGRLELGVSIHRPRDAVDNGSDPPERT